MSKKKKGDRRVRALRFSQLGFQMAAVIGIAAWGGQQIDEKMENEQPLFTAGLSLIGVFASLYLVFKEVKQMNE